MPTPLKDLYSKDFLEQFSKVVKFIHPNFDENSFINSVLNSDWKSLELKGRMRQITHKLHQHLTGIYQTDVNLLINCVHELRKQKSTYQGIEFIFIPDYIECYGLEDLPTSIEAMSKITSFISCEFAIRPFIVKYEMLVIPTLMRWSKDKNEHIRRLASEGSRPRLPWAMALPSFKKDPTAILPILENLKADKSEYVRRSVANNLNDISKDHPDLVLKICTDWHGENKETDKLVKHALRTLLKSNYPGVMTMFGFDQFFKSNHFEIKTKSVNIGKDLVFEFVVKNHAKKQSKLRLEYGIYFLLTSGKHNKKVFKISERTLDPGQVLHIQKKHRFRPITTRKFYSGKHYLSLITNGKEVHKDSFELIASF